MIPLYVLAGAFALALAITKNPHRAARIAFAIMFLFTAAAHFAPSQRQDLIRMVPPYVPFAPLVVTVTGVLEIAGAAGLLVSRTARVTAAALAILLVAMFPANVHAAVSGLTLMGKPATPLLLRTAIQLVFISGLAAIALKAPAPRAAAQQHVS